MRQLYYILGWIFTGFAILGILIPILPATPMALVALACFSRSSPRLRAWLWNHPIIGPLIRDWKERGAIRRSAKIQAVILIVLSFLLLIWLGHLPSWLLSVVAAILGGVILFIVTRPPGTKEQVK